MSHLSHSTPPSAGFQFLAAESADLCVRMPIPGHVSDNSCKHGGANYILMLTNLVPGPIAPAQ